MEEKRRSQRIKIRVEIGVYDINTRECLGHLVDISTEGIMLASGQAMKTNTLYEFRIVLPFSIYGKNEISFNAVCLWSNKAPGSKGYQAGFQIRDASIEVKELLEFWVENPSIENKKRP